MKIFQLFNSKQIKTAAIGSLFIKFLSVLFTFLSSIILARVLGLEQFGLYTLAFATVVLLTVPVSFGLPNLIIRFISKYEVENNNNAIKGLLIRTNQFVFVTTLIIWVIVIINYYLWWKNMNAILVEAIWYGLLLVPLIVLSSIQASILNGLRYVVLGQLSDTIFRNGLLLVGVTIYYVFELKLTPGKAIIIHIIATTISFLLGFFFLKRKLLFKIRNIIPVFYDKEWFKQALPFSITSGIQVIKSKLITYILAIFSSFESVAIFDIALRGASLAAFTLDALNTAIAPYISYTFEKKNMKRLQQILTKTSRIIFIFAVPVVLIFIIGGKPLLVFLFGKEYEASYLPLVILCIGQLVNTATGSVGILLAMTGRQAVFTKVILVSAILNLFLSVPFVMYFDTLGAAIVYSSLMAIQNIYLVFYVKSRLNFNTTIF